MDTTHGPVRELQAGLWHWQAPHPAWEAAAAIPRLLDAGFEDRIVLSQDVCWKTALRQYGGPGYAWILEHFLPRLRSDGIPESAIDAFIVRNPARLLTFVEPARQPATA